MKCPNISPTEAIFRSEDVQDEVLIEIQLAILLQMFCRYMINSTVILIIFKEPDDICPRDLCMNVLNHQVLVVIEVLFSQVY